jgi:hypothetical protein
MTDTANQPSRDMRGMILPGDPFRSADEAESSGGGVCTTDALEPLGVGVTSGVRRIRFLAARWGLGRQRLNRPRGGSPRTSPTLHTTQEISIRIIRMVHDAGSGW